MGVCQFHGQVPLVEANTSLDGFLDVVSFYKGLGSLLAEPNGGKLASNVLEQVIPIRDRVNLKAAIISPQTPPRPQARTHQFLQTVPVF